MAIKIYELTRMSTAFFTTKFCRTTIDLPFTEGRGSTGNNRATFSTDDRFTQDAIENDPRFGKLFYLAEVIKTEEDIRKEEEEARRAEEMANKVVEPIEEEDKPKKRVKKSNTNEVAEVKTLNDAFDYFANLGIAVESKDQLEQTMRELKVSFPNLEE